MIKRTALVMMVVTALVMGTVMISGCLHTVPTISVTKTGSDLQIVSFNQDLTTLEVLQKIDAAGLAPAALEEVMKEPKRVTKSGGLIFALGSAGVLPGDARVCYTVPGCPDRDPIMYIEIRMFCGPEYKWPANTNFGVVPK